VDPAKRIVTRLPLTELWNSAGIVDARRVGDIGKADIVRLLQDGSSLVVAEVGQPLLWIADEDRFAYWKAEISCHLVGAGPWSYCCSVFTACVRRARSLRVAMPPHSDSVGVGRFAVASQVLPASCSSNK
jgi:hypothetical protein